MGLLGRSKNGVSQVADVDATTHSVVTIDVPHHEIHEGEMFQCFEKQLSLGAATVKYAFTTSATKTAHLVVEVIAITADVTADLYHTATATSGTGLTETNRMLGSATLPTASVISGVTSTTGTAFDFIYVPAGNRSGEARNTAEWIVPVSNTIRIDLTGVATSKAIIKFHWYEE